MTTTTTMSTYTIRMTSHYRNTSDEQHSHGVSLVLYLRQPKELVTFGTYLLTYPHGPPPRKETLFGASLLLRSLFNHSYEQKVSYLCSPCI